MTTGTSNTQPGQPVVFFKISKHCLTLPPKIADFFLPPRPLAEVRAAGDSTVGSCSRTLQRGERLSFQAVKKCEISLSCHVVDLDRGTTATLFSASFLEEITQNLSDVMCSVLAFSWQ